MTLVLPNVLGVFPPGTEVGIYRGALHDSGNPVPIGDAILTATVSENGELDLSELEEDGTTYVAAAFLSGEWKVTRVTTPGPNPNEGPPGDPGTPGAAGNTILSGAGVPDPEAGTVNDYYLNTLNYRLYGPKTPEGWGEGTSLIGPPGDTGAPGITEEEFLARLPWVDPYDYGYSPLSADNTEAINDAIAALPAGEGGVVILPRGPIFCAGTINMTKRKGIILMGQATALPTTFDDEEWPCSTLMYTGEGERFIDARSCHGPRLQNIGVGYSNNNFTGDLIDFSHNGSVDTTVPQVIGCMIQGVGRVGSTYQSTARSLISLDQAISGQILGCRFHHAETAIRLQEAGTYCNAMLIQGNFFGHCYGYIANPGQGTTISANTFEGLQGGNIDYPHHAVFCDLPGGGSVTGVSIVGNWIGDAFGEQEWIRLKPLVGSVIEGNFISGGLGAIRFFNNEESSIVGSGVAIRNNNCATPKGYGIDLTNGDNIIWEGLEITGNGLGANFAEGPILNIPTGSPDRDVSIHSNYLRNPPPIVQPYFLTHTSKFTIVGGFAVSGDIAHTGTKVGFNGSEPVAKPKVTGSRGGNAALASLLTGLASVGLVKDETTA